MQQQRRRPPVSGSPVATNNNNSNRPIRQINRGMAMSVSQCSGCSQPMYNPMLSNVLDRLWHPDCVRCFTCRCILNEQCYSREGKLYCKDDFIKKYIHRCFSCQNLIQSHELIRRVRAGRIYHADCFNCIKCKRILQDDDIASLMPSDGSTLNDMDYICQGCINPTNKLVKSSVGIISSSNVDEDETTDSEISNTTHRRIPTIDRTVSGTVNTDELPNTSLQSPSSNTSVLPSIEQQLSFQSTTSAVDSQVNVPQPMQVDKIPTAARETVEETKTPPAKPLGRPPKTRQNSSTNSNKRTTAKSKPAVSRQKQTTTNEKKRRSPTTRSKASSAASTTVQTRSSNRRNTKTSRYRKRTFSSGTDEDESEDENDDDDEEEDTNFTEEDDVQDDERESNRSPATKTKSSKNANEKKNEVDSASKIVPPPLPSTTTLAPTQPILSEPLSLLSGLASNPTSVSSIIKSDIPASFMPPNFNPAFPTPQQFLPPNHPFPPGFSLQPRLPPPPPPSSQLGVTQPQPAPISDTHRSSYSTSVSETDSLDRPSSPSQTDSSTNAESGIGARQTTTPQKVSALSSLLEFGTLPPSNVGDIGPSGKSTNPFPFPFVTPGPGVPFSPQAAAGMTTYFRPPMFGVPPSTTSLDVTPQTSTTTAPSQSVSESLSTQPKKKATKKRKASEVMPENILDESSSPKKKARKTNPRGKGKVKKNETDGENDIADDNVSPLPSQAKKKKKKAKKDDDKDNIAANDSEESKVTNGMASNASHNLLTQMGLINPPFIPPTPSQSSSSATGTPSTPIAQQQQQQQQQAQIAAMYNMTPHFGAYNTFPGAFNPAFPGAAAYPGGYPPPYGFHPAFTTPPAGQPFPFIPPTSTASSINNTSSPVSTTVSPSTGDKPTPIVVPETRPSKSKSKSKNNTDGEKKKPAAPRSNKKKSVSVTAPVTTSDSDDVAAAATTVPSTEITETATTISESTPTIPPPASKRRISGTESEDFDEQNDDQQQQSSQTANGKSGNESDGSGGAADRSSSNTQSSSTIPEKKGGRTTIKPQQLDILNKSFDSCAKPNKTQREQLAADTGLNIRVIQVWFQNKRSKERKGKSSKEKDAPLDDDDAGEDSPPSSPQPPVSVPTSAPESTVESTPIITTTTTTSETESQ
ncbi:unnamed protein product [Adineta steineri]|uniref:Uncharacterized protein n=1 Tax=Adineta steineri TaxID=433720 RepID=A0A818LM25_9BILA|nr:unnamed protein product [Adineta steineri]CAF3509147.1 unnamed protein product [Adineta steineri]CAF3580381.1 unnamed protein product [Adineta steineri]